MGRSLSSTRGVVSHYGARKTGRTQGDIKTAGLNQEKVIEISGELLSDLLLQEVYFEAGAKLTKATLVVSEAFDLAASSVVEIGEAGSESTNGVSLTEANLETVDVVDVTSGLAGTFATTAEIPAYIDLGIAFSAGSVADASVGKAKLILEYLRTK